MSSRTSCRSPRTKWRLPKAESMALGLEVSIGDGLLFDRFEGLDIQVDHELLPTKPSRPSNLLSQFRDLGVVVRSW